MGAALFEDGCLGDEAVLALLEGRLDGETLAEADEHVDRCELCQSLVMGAARGVGRGLGALGEGARLGRYVVVDELGRGGFGVVLRAYDPELDRRVALKVLHHGAEGAEQPRLADEARAMAKLNHPHVVTVYEVGLHRDATFVAMELVEGETLREWLGGDPPWQEVVARFREAGEGLAAAHAAGLVHGDFKPANVLLGRDGRVRVTDFGLASVADLRGADLGDLDLTQSTALSGRLVGTPIYMAPEQLRGRAADAKSDQYAFCLSLFEGLAGRRPFDAANLDELLERADERDAPGAIDGVPRWLAAVIQRGLANDPAQRHPDLARLLTALANDPRKRRRRWATGAVLLSTCALLGAAIAAEPAPCSGGAALADEVWSTTRKEQLAESLGAAGAGVDATMTRWTTAWADAYRSSCIARRDAPSDAEEARRRCLTRQRREVDALVRAFVSPSPDALARVADAFAALPAPAQCDRASAAALTPDQEAALGDVDEALATAKARVAVGDFAEARRLGDEIVGKARDAAHDPTLAAGALVLGEAQWQRGRLQEAEETTLHALWAARRAKDERAEALAWLQRAAIAGTAERLDDAAEALHHAEAASTHLGDDRLVARLHNARGVLATHRGRFDEAERELQAGLDLRRRLWGGDHPHIARSLTSLGNLARLRGDLAQARTWHEAARTMDRRLLGEEHPNEARHLHNLARIDLLAGEPAEAKSKYERALALRKQRLGERHPDVGVTLNSLGLWHREQGDDATARRLFEEAAARLEATRPRAAARARQNLEALRPPAEPAPTQAPPSAPLTPPPTPTPALATPPSSKPIPPPKPAPPPKPLPGPPPPPGGAYMPGEAWN